MKKTVHVLRLTKLCNILLLRSLNLATIFGLNVPSSGQYLQKNIVH